MPESKRVACPKCGREIAETHLARHQGTWACLKQDYFNRYVAPVSMPIEDGLEYSDNGDAALVSLAYDLGMQDQLKPHIFTIGTDVIVGVQGPEWLVVAADNLLGSRHLPTVVSDVKLVCRFFCDHPDTSLRDGMVVAIGLIKNSEDLDYWARKKELRSLFRTTASKIMTDFPDYALGAAELELDDEGEG